MTAGFSLVGLLIAVAVLAPNLLLVVLPPLKGELPTSRPALVFVVLERVGQAACLAVLILFGTTFDGRQPDVFFALMVLAIAAYYGLWLRYLALGRDATALYSPLGFLPIPMAILPVLAFALAAGWGGSVWLLIAAVVLAIGHWTTSWHSRAQARR